MGHAHKPFSSGGSGKRLDQVLDYTSQKRASGRWKRSMAPRRPQIRNLWTASSTCRFNICVAVSPAWYHINEATVAFSEGLDPVFVPPLGPGNVPTTSALISDGLEIVRQGTADVLAISSDDRSAGSSTRLRRRKPGRHLGRARVTAGWSLLAAGQQRGAGLGVCPDGRACGMLSAAALGGVTQRL